MTSRELTSPLISTDFGVLDKMLRRSRFVVAGLVLYATLFQLHSGNENDLFFLVSWTYFAFQLITGFASLKFSIFEHYGRFSVRVVRAMLDIGLVAYLLDSGGGRFEYYLLFFPQIIMFNRHVVEREKGIKYSYAIGLIACTLYSLVQFDIMKEIPSHVSSTMARGVLIIFVSTVSFYLWKNRQAHAQHVGRISNLNELAKSVTSVTSYLSLINELVSRIHNDLGADIVSVLPFDNEKGRFVGPISRAGNLRFPESENSEIGKKHIAHVIIDDERDYFIEDAQENPMTARRGEYADSAHRKEPFVKREEVKAVAGLYLRVEEQPVGVMFVNYRANHKFEESEKRLLGIYAAYTAIAIRNLATKENLERYLIGSIEVMNKLSHFSPQSEESILKLVLDQILYLTNEHLGYFSEHDEPSAKLKIKITSEAYSEIQGFEYAHAEGMTGLALRTAQIQLFPNPDVDKVVKRFSDVKDERFRTLKDKESKAAIAVPLLVNDKVIGVYLIESKQKNAFSLWDVKIVKSLVDQAAIAVSNIRNQIFLMRLRSIDKEIVTNLNSKTVLKTILGSVLEFANASNGNILLIDDVHTLRVEESTSPETIGQTITIAKSISGLAVERGTTVYLADLRDEKELQRRYVGLLGKGLVCELVVPLKVKGEIIGVLNTESPQPGAFTATQIQHVEALAGQAAVTIYNARLFQKVERSSKVLETLAEIEIDKAILDSNLDLEGTLEVIVRKGLGLIKEKQCGILLLDESKQELVVRKSTTAEDEDWRLKVNDCLGGLAVAKAKVVYAPDVDGEPSENILANDQSVYTPNWDELKLYKSMSNSRKKSNLIVPLWGHEGIIGVLNAESDLPNGFSIDEINLIRNLSGISAMAIENAQRFAALEEAKNALENSVDKELVIGFGQMLAVFQHELSNYIGLIRLDAIDLLEIKPLKDELARKIRKIKKNAEHMLDLPDETDKFISFGKEPVHISSIIREALEIDELHQEKEISLTRQGIETLPPIEGNYALLRNGVFFELFRNAIKSMPDGGVITVSGSYSSPEENLELYITDTGHGIQENELEKVFDPRYTKWKDGRGSGKGLFLVKAIVKLHRGEIKVSSDGKRGTTFTIKLPIPRKERKTL